MVTYSIMVETRCRDLSHESGMDLFHSTLFFLPSFVFFKVWSDFLPSPYQATEGNFMWEEQGGLDDKDIRIVKCRSHQWYQPRLYSTDKGQEDRSQWANEVLSRAQVSKVSIWVFSHWKTAYPPWGTLPVHVNQWKCQIHAHRTRKKWFKNGLENVSKKVHRAICSLIHTLLSGMISDSLFALKEKHPEPTCLLPSSNPVLSSLQRRPWT